MKPKGTLGLCSIDMTQLITHVAFMQKALAMQLCYIAFWHIAEGN